MHGSVIIRNTIVSTVITTCCHWNLKFLLDFHSFFFAHLTIFCLQASSFFHASIIYPQFIVSGCLHNNTMFADTSIVPSSEPCLVCKCSKRNLVCVRRVCKDQVWCELKLNGRKRARAVKSKRNEKKVVGTSFSTSRSLHLSPSLHLTLDWRCIILFHSHTALSTASRLHTRSEKVAMLSISLMFQVPC